MLCALHSIRFQRLGENIAAGRIPLNAHVALPRSPPHHSNMISPVFTSVGIAAVPAPPYGWYVVQLFASWPPTPDPE